MPRPPMYLLTGPEELLLHRAAEDLLTELRAEGDIEVTDVRASELKESGMPDLRTGSLFGDRRVIIVREAHELPAEISHALAAELDGSPPDATVVLLAGGTQRILKLAKRVKELGGRVDVAPPKDWEGPKWARHVAEELRRHGRSADPDAVHALLAHAGQDIAGIAEKVAQVAATAAPGRITAEQVEHVVVGRGNRGSFAVADAMCQRQPGEALTLLRGVLESGDEPLMVLGALAYRIRSIVAVAGRVDTKSVGLTISKGQGSHLEAARRRFGPGELTMAYRTLAAADLEMKGGELPPALVLERAVVQIATPQEV